MLLLLLNTRSDCQFRSKETEEYTCGWILTFTALAVSSENGGTTPDNTIATDKLNITKVARMIALFAPGHQLNKK